MKSSKNIKIKYLFNTKINNLVIYQDCLNYFNKHK